MKKLFIVILSGVAVISCSKDQTCACTLKGDEDQEVIYTFRSTDRDAQSSCEGFEETEDADTVTCVLL